MTPDDGQDSQPDHRAYYEASGDDIEIRQPDDEDGVFEIRMPIVSTGEVRNENDNPFTRDELEGMAQQIGNGVVSVFPDHGQTAIGGPNRYSIAEKGGEWQDAEVVGEQDTDSDAAELVATARLMDPDTLPDIPIREMLGTIKELVNRDMSVPSSIGWKEDDNAPGGNDLMEASIVGIPADPRTTSDTDVAAVMARSAVEAGADPGVLLESVKRATEDQRDLTSEQVELARSVLQEFESEQGDATLADFDSWVFESDDDLSADESVAARAVIDEYVRSTTPWQDPISETLRPWLSEQSETDDEMSDDNQSADDADNDQDEQPDEGREQETLERLVELQEAQMETLEAISEAVREDDDEDDDEDDSEENETDEDEDDEDDENAGDEADEQSAEGERDLEAEVSDLREQLDDLRAGGIDADDVDTPDADDEQDADEAEDNDDTHELTTKYGIQ